MNNSNIYNEYLESTKNAFKCKPSDEPSNELLEELMDSINIPKFSLFNLRIVYTVKYLVFNKDLRLRYFYWKYKLLIMSNKENNHIQVDWNIFVDDIIIINKLKCICI